jgi:hypothetical protein
VLVVLKERIPKTPLEEKEIAVSKNCSYFSIKTEKINRQALLNNSLLRYFRLNGNISEVKTVSENFKVALVDVLQIQNVSVRQHREVDLRQFLVFLESVICGKKELLLYFKQFKCHNHSRLGFTN